MARISRRRPVRRGSKLRSPRTGGDQRPQLMVAEPDSWQRFTAVAGVFSVLLVGVGLVLTNDFNRDQLALQQVTAQQQQDLALKGQRSERFIRAVDQLGQEGKDELGIRLGGIYALEALMKEFSTDQNVVTEVLCAFVRSHAPWRDEDKSIPDAQPDVRAAMTVLGRRPAPATHAPLDLSNTALGLEDFNLPGASFRDVDLSVSSFSDAKLSRADLRGSDISRAFLDQADLRGADLTGVDLHSTSLRGTNLTGATLRNVNFTGADLTGADLSGADLTTVTGSLTNAQLGCARTDAATRLPTGLTAPPANAWQQPRCVVDP